MRAWSALALAGLMIPAAAAAAEMRATMQDAEGRPVGLVTLTEMPLGTVIRVELTGVPPGWHGFHLHETGRCEPPFTSAGGHLNPAGARHGLDQGGMHAGDLPNIHADAQGAATAEMIAPGLKLDETMLDGDGVAVVLHAGTDDYRTDPSGGSGDRIACGVISRP